MMGTLWTESSYPGPHALQLTSAETPPLPSSAVNTEAERGRLPAQNHGKAGMVPGLEPGLLPPNLSPSALGVTPPNPAPLFLTPNIKPFGMGGQSTSVLRAEGGGLRNTPTPEPGLQTPRALPAPLAQGWVGGGVPAPYPRAQTRAGLQLREVLAQSQGVTTPATQRLGAGHRLGSSGPQGPGSGRGLQNHSRQWPHGPRSGGGGI